MIVLISFVASALLFAILFMNRYRVFHFIIDETALTKSTAESVARLQTTITKKHISKNDQKRIREEMKEYRHLTMQLYDSEGVYYTDHASPLEKDVYIETSSFLLMLYYPQYEDYTLKFYDGTYNLTVYSYQGVWFMELYVIGAIVLCVMLFLLLIMRYIRRKINYILKIGDEMKLIESGDFQHPILYEGKDELTDLAIQLNQLRSVLDENMRSEKEAKQANQDLVTAMSHDLRTPLTSLLGYLDILDMKIYKNEEERSEYIRKCKIKADQIKDMSDRLFTHFLIYAQDENIQLQLMDQDQVNVMLEAFGNELIDSGFEIQLLIDAKPFKIMAETSLLKRIFDNLLSNIRKYGSSQVEISLRCEEKQLCMCIKNDKKEHISKEESSHIGLKSVRKMLSYMNATLVIQEVEDIFVVQLVFPLSMDGLPKA